MKLKNKFFLFFVSMNLGIAIGQDNYVSIAEDYILDHPAYFSLDDAYHVNAFSKNQWKDFKVAQALSVHKSFRYEQFTLGLVTQHANFNTGVRDFKVAGVFGYKINLIDGKLAFGVKAGTNQQNVNFDHLPSYDEQDPTFTPETKWFPTLSSGLYFRNEKLQLGISTNNLLGTEAVSSNLDLSLLAGYSFDLHQFLKIEPLVTFRKEQQTQNVLLGRIKFVIPDYAWLAVSQASQAEYAIGGGLYLKSLINGFSQDIRVAYSFRNWWNDLSAFNGIHEIGLQFNFKPRPSSEKIKKNKEVESPLIFE